jgi:O-antigen ligase
LSPIAAQWHDSTFGQSQEFEMSAPETVNNLGISAPAITGLLAAGNKPRPRGVFLRLASCLAFIPVFGAAFFLGGVETGTILLAILICAWAFYKPRSGLWASTAFLIYVFVFFQKGLMTGPDLPSEFYYWGAGLAIITLGLGVAWVRIDRERRSRTRTQHQVRFDRAMILVLAVSLVASAYGLARGNRPSLVARQLFGCLLLPIYYVLARSFFRTAEDVGHWLHCVTWAVAAGAAWYVMKLGLATLSEDAYYRKQSPLAFFAGVVGAVLFVEVLQARHFANRARNAAAFAVCVLAIVLMGARFVAGSLAATAIVFVVLSWRKRRLAVLLPALVLLVAIIPFGAIALERLVERPGVVGEIASRFSPFQLDEDSSYIGRAAQWQAVVDVAKQHPILGAGMGSELPNFTVGWDEMYMTASVDNGWGYVLLKMGFVGVAVFLYLIGSFLRCASTRTSAPASANSQSVRRCLVALLLFGLFSFMGGPTFFHFTSSGFLGTAFGGLAVLAGTVTQPRVTGSARRCPVL